MRNNYQYKKEQWAIRRLLFFCLFFFFSVFLFGQNLLTEKFKEVAIGYSIIHEKLPEGYNYTPLFVTARFPIYQFSTKKKRTGKVVDRSKLKVGDTLKVSPTFSRPSKKGVFNIFAEPQFVVNNAPNPFPTTYEFGVNVGVQYFFPFSEKNGFSASISAGPHYLSLETSMQAKGFIFSDNFEIGYYHQLGKKLGVSIKPRFRHLSNAGFQSPNIGIDNLFLMVGVFWHQ